MRTCFRFFAGVLFLFLGLPHGRAAADGLEKGFVQPPAEARPWVYWFWLNGNITSNGVTADLEAMKRVGIGGVLIMEVDQGAPIGPIDFMGTRWRELFKHVHSEAKRLGLEVNMNNDAGWNGSGGPWIKPELSMQKVVWSETNVAGPARFEADLKQPETVAGFYRDIAAVAFPSPGKYRIDRIRAKAMYEMQHIGSIAQEQLAAEMVVLRDRLTVLNKNGESSGHLVWDVPAGQWTIVRFGHTSTGAENAPAPKTGRGLECDKLSREGIEANFNGMMAQLAADNGLRAAANSAGLVATHIDSWENGSQNWTARMREEFEKQRGYDLLPFLPVMTGRVIDSLEISERFLWDLRRTISELVVENYAGHFRELAHAQGMRFTVEAYGSPCDYIPYGGESDEPMGEFWSPSGSMETCKGMAGSAHVYGKRIVGAEAFTAGDHERWREHPASIKVLGDHAFCEGINRFVFHRYALQPWREDRRPGMTMGPWGQHYERTQTWWDETPAWHQYLARCQFLLRQGLFAADICYVQAEMPPQGFSAHPRQGYDWDECGAEVVLNRMSVKDGRIVLPDGMSYRVLALAANRRMTPGLLRKVKELAQDGATIIGTPPEKSPSLANYPKCDAEVKQLAQEIWGEGSVEKGSKHALGKGQVVWGTEPDKVLRQMGVPPDFTSSEPLRFIHRVVGDEDIYFVANPNQYELTTTATFRVRGKIPEIWWPEDGRIERAPFQETKAERTSVVLPLGPGGSVFVVFRKPAGQQDSFVSLAHNGRELLSAASASPRSVIIRRAVYGVLTDPLRTRDVRAKVQGKVDSGEYRFRASAIADGDDPAPEIVKTLAVDYSVDGKEYSVKAEDPVTILLSADAMQTTVTKARYGVLDDPKRTRDVRQRVQRLVDAGETSFTVARMAERDDPAYLVVKTLELEFTRGDEKIAVSGQDPEVIELKRAVRLQERVVELHGLADGRVQGVFFQPGTYELRTAKGKHHEFKLASLPQPFEVTGPWQVQFPPSLGVPPAAAFERLVSWTAHADPGIKYFSGAAVYRKTVHVPRELRTRQQRLYLDLGRVEVMAEVSLNGKNLGLLWKAPFRLDVTDAVRAGDNLLEVKVVNLWPNRMIGDEQLPEDSDRNPNGTLKSWPEWLTQGNPNPAGRIAFTSWRLWKKSDALLESGLLGPVRIVAGEVRVF